MEPPLPFAIPPLLPVHKKNTEQRVTAGNQQVNYNDLDLVWLTSELSHDLLHRPASRVSVAVGAVRRDEVISQINWRLNSNCTSFL